MFIPGSIASTLRRRLRQQTAVVAWIMGLALLAPFAGPALDHHFAERQPGHAHAFLSGVVEHGHDPLQPHLHGPGEGAGDGVVSLLDSTVSPGASQSPSALAPESTSLASLSRPLPAITDGGSQRPNEHITAPPPEPPRA